VVFSGVLATTQPRLGAQLLSFVTSLAIGVVGGAIGTALLWLLVRKLPRGETLDTSAQLASVIAVPAGCDIIREPVWSTQDIHRCPRRRDAKRQIGHEAQTYH
jgi:hypothetical protein